jgi:hypothetical protein
VRPDDTEIPEDLFREEWGGRTFTEAIAAREAGTPWQNMKDFIVLPVFVTAMTLVLLAIPVYLLGPQLSSAMGTVIAGVIFGCVFAGTRALLAKR